MEKMNFPVLHRVYTNAKERKERRSTSIAYLDNVSWAIINFIEDVIKNNQYRGDF